MRVTYFSTLFVIIIAHIVIPVFILLWVAFPKNRSQFTWAVKILISSLYIYIIYLAGYWQQLSYYFKYLLVLLYLASAIKSVFYARKLPRYENLIYVEWMGIMAGVGISAILAVNIVSFYQAFFFKSDAVDLSLPFDKGVYMVCFGGNGEKSPLANYHYRIPLYARQNLDPSVKYATDILELNTFGKSGSGLLSKDPKAYAIFGQTILSPCDGVIVDAVDKWDDEMPLTFDHPYNPGNSIVISYKDVFILLGHLEKGSIKVSPGQMVKRGEPIARAGNSGWTTEPHLHIQAMKTYTGLESEGEGIPILFGGRFPVKNELFIK